MKKSSRSGGGLAYLLLFILLAAGIIAGGCFAYRNYVRHFRAAAEEQLSAIADLKVVDLTQWRKERLADAVSFRTPAFAALVRRFFENPQDSDTKRMLQTWIQNYPARLGYARVSLADTQGVIRLSAPEASQTGVPYCDPDAVAGLSARQPVLSRMRRDTPDNAIHMAVLIPIQDEQKNSSLLGVLVLRIDPATYLYPFIQRWPTPSRTAETLLVRREGNEVVFLNDLRFKTNTALNLRMPLNRLDLPAVHAVLGEEGIMEGVDYRGERVVAALRTIPNSPWALVARLDFAEVYAPMRGQLWQIVILTGALLFGAAGCVALAWRHQRSRIYKERAKAAEAIRASEIRYRRLFEAARDGVLILHAETGMVEDVNPYLTELLGWSRADFLGKKIWELGFFKNKLTNQENFAELQQKKYIRYEDMALEARDGTRREVEFVSNVYQANHHRTIQCNIRDISERKQAETYHELSREILQILNEPGDLQQALPRVLAACKTRRGLDAVGLRLQDGDDFPYFTQQGFPTQFLQTENSLLECVADGGVCRNPDGTARLKCTCGLVLSGKTDPANPLCTPGGSFWTNDSFPLLDLPDNADPRLHPCNQCIHQGYASVALVPIRNKRRIVGLIHFAARRKGCFSIEGVKRLEDIASHIGEALLRRQSEDALRKSKEMFRALIEGLPDIVARFDCEGRHEFISDNINRVLDLDTVQFIGKTHRELGFSEAQCRFWEDSLQRVFASGAPFEAEVTVNGRNGQVLYNCRFVPERNVQGTLRSVLVIGRDITAHRQAEKNYQMLFREMLNGFALHEIVCDAQGKPVDYRFLDVNPAFERMTGLQVHDLLGKSVREIMPGTEPNWIQTYGKVALTGEPVFFEDYSAELKKHFEVAAFRPAPNQFACIVADITDRKRMEAEREKTNRDLQNALQSLQEMQAQMLQQARLSTLGQLSSGIAHDFNNILMPILGYSELLLSDPSMLDNRGKTLAALQRINHAALDARQITSRLRWIYRPDTEASYCPVDLNEVARDALTMTRTRWEEELGAKGILVRVATKLEARTLALGDAPQLREALMNLILNAVDAMPQGGVLTLSSAVEHPDVVLCVADTGTGMTEEVKARCQEAFFTSKSATKGSGLGLTIVAGIMSRHKGTVEIDSAPGRGTTVRLRLPCAPDGSTVEFEAKAVPEQPASAHLRILLADDDAEVLSLLDHVLRKDGHTVEKAQSGAEAVAKVGNGTFDLVITDRSMPEVNGDEVARAAKAHNPDTPVILLTGFGDLMNDAGECPPGVTRVLSKPILPQALLQAICKVMADRRRSA